MGNSSTGPVFEHWSSADNAVLGGPEPLTHGAWLEEGSVGVNLTHFWMSASLAQQDITSGAAPNSCHHRGSSGSHTSFDSVSCVPWNREPGQNLPPLRGFYQVFCQPRQRNKQIHCSSYSLNFPLLHCPCCILG